MKFPAIHAQEELAAARDKTQAVVAKLRGMKLRSATGLVEKVVEQTLTYYHFPSEHWRRIRNNNPMERIIREIRRRPRGWEPSPKAKAPSGWWR